MKMGFRWYGDGNDTVTLDDIRQIPGVETVVWSLHHKQAGEVWETAEIDAEMARITAISAEAAARGVTKRSTPRWSNRSTCTSRSSSAGRCSG